AWYIEFDTIVGDTLVVRNALELIMKDGPRYSLHLNVDKIKVFLPKEDPRRSLEGVFPPNISHPLHCVKLLGGPASMDFDFSSELVMKRMTKTIGLIDLLRLMILNLNVLLTWLSVLPIELIETVFRLGFGDWQWMLTHLPFAFKGLGNKATTSEGKLVLVDDDGKPFENVDYPGNTSSEDVVELVDNEIASYLASKPIRVGYGPNSLLEQLRESLVDYEYDPYDDDMYKGREIPKNIEIVCDNLDIKSAGLQAKLLRVSSIVAFRPTFDNALCVFNTSKETDLLSNPSEIVAPKLMKKLADIYFTRVIDTAESTFSLSPRNMALWKSQMECHISDWLRVVPIYGLGDIYKDHAVSCAGIIGIKHRHNVVRNTLVDICYRSGISAGLDVCVDLTGSSPLTQTGMANFVLGHAVIDARQRKCVKYEAKCAAIGYGFLHFSFFYFGELEEDAITLLKWIQKFSITQDIRHVLLSISLVGLVLLTHTLWTKCRHGNGSDFMSPPDGGDGVVRFLLYDLVKPQVSPYDRVNDGVSELHGGFTLVLLDSLFSKGLRTVKSLPPSVLLRETLAEFSPTFLDVDDDDLDLGERNIKQCRRRICDGHYTAAIRVLSSSCVAPYGEATLEDLKTKHHFHPAPSLPHIPTDHHHLLASSTMVLDRIKSFPRGTSCGWDGLRAQHLMDCLSGAVVAVSDELVSSIAQMIVTFCIFSSFTTIMPPRRLKKKSIKRLVEKRVAKAIEEYEKSRANLDSAGSSGGNPGNAGGTMNVHGCSHKTFMNGKPHTFNGTEGVVGLRRWIEKVEQVFETCKCAEEDKVMFAASTFEGRALTWWNGNVHTLGLVNANHIPWTEFKTMMTTEYCPATEIQRMEQELWTLTLKGDDIEAYNNRFHELALMCPELVPTEKKKIERYTRGFPERIKGNITSSKPATLHDAINMARELVEQAVQGKATRIGESNKRKWEDHQRNTNNNNNNPNNSNNNNNRNRNINYPQQQNRRQETIRAYAAAPVEGKVYARNLTKCNRCNLHHHGPCPPKCRRCQRMGHMEKDCRARLPSAGDDFLQNMTCFSCGKKGHYKNKCSKAGNQQNEGARARAYVVLKNPFVSSAFTPFIDIAPTALNTSYEVKLADGKVVSTNTVLRGCILALYNHIFKIDLLLTRLGSFDVIIGMDWLSYHWAVIDCYETMVRIPLPNGEILEVQGERPEKDPGSLACIKADEKKLDNI
ncbi:putative reverse transcriptase domain-containing protein, partial [Tanacetum coccineum]